jgi:iron(III) transport system substrate-binding protein
MNASARLAAIAFAALASTSTMSLAIADENSLVVYTPNSQAIIDIIVPAFEEKTGIKVEVLNAGAGEVLTRVKAERNAPYADILMGAVRGEFDQYFEEYVSPEDSAMVETSRNVTGFATPYISNGSVLLVNDEKIGDIKVESYADLLNPALKGKIAAADPATSSSAFAQLTNQLLAMGGDYTSDAGWDFVAGLIKNLDGKVSPGSSNVHKSVADGEYAVGVTYEEPSATYVSDGAPVHIVYPSEGAVFLDSYVGINKGAPNRENAEKFIDFVISAEIQARLGSELTIRPLRADAQAAGTLPPFSSFKILVEDSDVVTEQKKAMLDRYADLFASLQ